MRRPAPFLLVAVSSLCAAAPARAQEPVASASCVAPAYRTFDFWIGDWDVYNPRGVLAGRNVIRAVHGGCALQEQWTGASGVTGGSINAWDASAGVWRQTWVDSSGMVLELEGGVQGDAMVMSGRVVNADGSQSLHRITWTPLPDRTVRQHWQVSGDEGATWSTLFDGVYRRR